MNRIRAQHKMRSRRRGTVAVFLCLIMVPLLALFAFSVDYGFLLYVKTDIQRAADKAALAGVMELVPDEFGRQDLDSVRETIKDYVQKNLGDDFVVDDSDIEIGRFDTTKIYTSVELKNSGIRDTVRVTIRRNDLANNSVYLYFARVFDKSKSNVAATATAVLQKGRYIGPGTAILPIVVSEDSWEEFDIGESFSVYGDGRITDSGGSAIPGNWGTVDIGPRSNSTSDLRDQISNGISQSDLDDLKRQKVISTSEYIDSQDQIRPNGDTGFSAGMKHAVDDEIGAVKLVPLYSKTTGKGGNLTYTIAGWGAVKIEDTHWQGNKKTFVKVTKSYMYDRYILPNPSLSDTTNIMEGVYTSPALVE